MATTITKSGSDPYPTPVFSNGKLTINLGAIISNWKKLRSKAVHGNCAAVVKADAYGLGSVRVTRALNKAGCREFFTATIGEGVLLRKAAPDANIYIFNGYNPRALASYRKHKLIPVINSPAGINEWINSRTGKMSAALHIDTGINRLGLTMEEVGWLANSADLMTKFKPELVISHFACADDPGHPLNERQIEAFRAAVSNFPDARKSMANSAGVFLGKKAHFDLLRPGIALYGGNPINGAKNLMKPVVRLEGRIIQVKRAPKGEFVGYGATQKLIRDSTLGIVAIGYADGLHRAASGSGTPLRDAGLAQGGMVMLGKHIAPILGRVSMDMITIDLTDVPKRALSQVIWVDLINSRQTIDDAGRSSGTIGYEILTSLGRRYERLYVE